MSAESGADTRTARDLAGAEAALKRAGWERRSVTLNPVPSSLADQVDRLIGDFDALSRFSEKFHKSNPIMDFFSTEGGKVAMEHLMPVIVQKLAGGPTALQVVRENPAGDEWRAETDARLASIEQSLQMIASRLGDSSSPPPKRGAKR